MDTIPTLAELKQLIVRRQEEQKRREREAELERQENKIIQVIRNHIEKNLLMVLKNDMNTYISIIAENRDWYKYNENRYHDYSIFNFNNLKNDSVLREYFYINDYDKLITLLTFDRENPNDGDCWFHNCFLSAVEQICNDVKKQKGYEQVEYNCTHKGVHFDFYMGENYY